MASRPCRNSARFRQRLSVVYASATRAGSRVFHASSAWRAFCAAVSAVKGGSGGRLMGLSSDRWEQRKAERHLRPGLQTAPFCRRRRRCLCWSLAWAFSLLLSGARWRGRTAGSRAITGDFVITDVIKGARIVAQPVGVAADPPVLRLELVDRHPDAPRIRWCVVGTFGREHHAGEIADQPLVRQQVAPVDRNADLDEIKRLLMVRTAGVVVGVFGHLVNPALHHLAGGRRVRHLFPPHEDFGQFCHHRVLTGLGSTPRRSGRLIQGTCLAPKDQACDFCSRGTALARCASPWPKEKFSPGAS